MSISLLRLVVVLSFGISCVARLSAAPKEQPASRGAKLALSSKELEPTTTFEVRFDEPVGLQKTDQDSAQESPLVFHPKIAGTFRWLSRQSGVFTPSEPLQLGTTYRVTLRPGLANADGKPLAAELNETVSAPPMRVNGFWPNSFSHHDAPSKPQIHVLFNADVNTDAADLARFFFFKNNTGQRIPAAVKLAPSETSFPTWYAKDKTVLTWRQRFEQQNESARLGDQRRARYGGRGSQTRAGAQNLFIAEPVKPLPVGQDWRLIVEQGLPSTEEGLRTFAVEELKIGDVRPFTVAKVETSNIINAGKKVEVIFSKDISRDVKPESVSQWLSFTPPAPDAKIAIEDSHVTITGDFEIGKSYTLKVTAGFPSTEAFTLDVPFEKQVAFEPIPSRLYFPEITTHQMSSGAREIPLLAINVPEIRLRAKTLDAETTILALQEFRHYFKQNTRWDEDEFYQAVNENAVPGRSVFDKEITGTEKTDEQKFIPVAWDEILGGAGKTGAVFLTAEEPGTEPKRKGTQMVVQLTDLGVVWKHSKSGSLVHVFSQASGKSVPDATVRLLDEKCTLLAEAKTDAQGNAQLPSNKDADWLVAAKESDFHVVEYNPEQRENLPLYRFHLRAGYLDVDEEAPGNSGTRRVMLFSERGVYKPGETVQLKGIVRDLVKDAPTIPAGEKFKLRAFDPRGRKFFEKELSVSGQGSFAEAIKLPSGGGLGRYRVAAAFKGTPEGEEVQGESEGEEESGFAHSFQVQEYQPNAFEIKLAAPKQLFAGAKLEVPVFAKYYMGKPLGKAQLHWSLKASDAGFAPDGFEDFIFCKSSLSDRFDGDEEDLGREDTEINLNGEETLSERGEITLAPAISPNPKLPQPRDINLLVEITDLNQQTVSESTTFTRHSSDFYLGMQKFENVIRQGEALPIQLVAARADGMPNEMPVNATVKLTRVDWQTNRIEGAGRSYGYRSEPNFETIAQTQIQTVPVQKKGDKWTPAQSPQPNSQLVPDKSGLYIVEASTRDATGRAVITSATVYVSGKDELAWDYKNDFEIKLVPDKEDYLSGETATLLVKTPITGDAWVTIERDNVRRSFLTKLEGNAPSIQIPLENGDAPNVFVSVMLIRGANDSLRKVKMPDYRLGYCELRVTDPQQKLQVAVRSDAPAHQPGEKVMIATEVRDIKGALAANAEVTLYAVDEGVLSLTGYETPDPYGFFNQPRPLGVQTGVTLRKLLPEDPDQRSFGNKGYLIGGGGEGELGLGNVLRKNFKACAFWSADLRTDANGRVAASFIAPDGLTRYRVIAVAQTTQSQFGSGEAAFEVNKPLMVEPVMPRFGNVGDKVLLRALVHNQTGGAGDIVVSLDLDDKAISDAPLTQKITLAARGSGTVDFPVTFKEAGQATWIWKAKLVSDPAKPLSDSVQSVLNVGYPVPMLSSVQHARTTSAQANLLADANPELLEGTGLIRVSVSNTRIIELQEPMRNLLHYPYGCVEQTTSSTLPWIVLSDFQKALPDLQKSPEEIADAAQYGINRILSMQTDTGGLSYWPGGRDPMLWGSAYGGVGLALAKRYGHFVPEQKFDKLCEYVSKQLRDETANYDRYALSDRCLAVYMLALAGRSEPAYHERLFQKRNELSVENRALLALAILESGGAKEMATELLEKQPTNKSARPEQVDDFWCAPRQLAIQLLAWSRFRPDDKRIDPLVTELFGSRRGGHWFTTQGNAWALLALTNYLALVEHPAKDTNGSLTWGTETQDYKLAGKATMDQLGFRIDRAKSRTPLLLANPAGAQLFTETKIEARPRVLQQPRRDQGYAIQRTYSKVADDGTLSPLINADARVGDRVLVTLHIEVRDRASYVAVDDPLPSVLEAVNPEFKTQQTRATQALGMDWVSDYKELREDRALFFADYLFPGTYTLRYVARVRAAGTVTAPAAKIEEMYHPDRFGLTETAQLTTKPLE